MDRRAFVGCLSTVALSYALPKLKTLAPPEKMGVVVHSYGIRFNTKYTSEEYPTFKNPLDLIQHCHQLGAGGVQVGLRNWTTEFTGKVRDLREKLGMYLEGSIRLPKDKTELNRFTTEVQQAKEAGAKVIRTACLSGRRYETFTSMTDFLAFKKATINSLKLAEPVMRKQRMKLAVENHKDWRVSELTQIMQHFSSEWMGVTIDFGNSMSLMEVPLETVKGLAPYIYSTHVKDMGVQEYKNGFLLSEVPLGQGVCDLQQMIDICRLYNSEVNFNLEMITRDPLKVPYLTDKYWQTFDDLPGRAVAKTLEMVKTKSYPGALPAISHLDATGKLAAEEDNVKKCLSYSQKQLKL